MKRFALLEVLDSLVSFFLPDKGRKIKFQFIYLQLIFAYLFHMLQLLVERHAVIITAMYRLCLSAANKLFSFPFYFIKEQ